MPSPWTLRTVDGAAAAGHPGVDGLGQPFRSAGTAAGSKPRPRSRTNSDTDAGFDLGEEGDDVGARPLHGVDRRLTRSREQGAQIVVELAVPDGDDLDSHPVLRLHLLLDEPHPAARVMPSPSTEPGARPSNSQERSSRSWARASWITCRGSSARRWIRASVCEDRVVHPRGHVGPLFGPGPGLTLDDEVAGDAQPPGAEHHHDRGDHERHAAQWPQQGVARVPGQQREQAAGQQQARDRHPQRRSVIAGVSSLHPSSGSARRRIIACSSAGAFRQISTRPATLMTSGQASEPSQPAPSAEAMRSTTTSSDPRPAASAMPRRSVSALLGDVAVLAGSRHQQPGHDVGRRAEAAEQGGHHERGPHDRDVEAVRAASPAATPPARRSSRPRRSGPPLLGPRAP